MRIPLRSYVAYFRHWGRMHPFPVIAWSDDGAAMVLHPETNRLMPADGFADFDSLEEFPGITAVGAVPGGGWRAVRKNKNGTDEEYPVLAWAVTIRGWAVPVVLQPGQVNARPLLEEDTDLRLVPPSQPPSAV